MLKLTTVEEKPYELVPRSRFRMWNCVGSWLRSRNRKRRVGRAER
jgi:hypothetical protein